MVFFSKVFKRNSDVNLPNIQFGRHTTTTYTDLQYNAWTNAVVLYEQEKYLKSFERLLHFMTDAQEENILYTHDKGAIQFSLYQGSKVIEGYADAHIIRAKTRVARMTQPNPELLQWLLEENYYLKYCRFSLDDQQCICLIFDTFVEAGTPHRVYEALRELAIKADNKDDVLISRYPDLIPVKPIRLRIPDDQEVQTKYQYTLKWIQHVMDIMHTSPLNQSEYAGGTSYLLMDVLFRIDFLIKPEGTIMEDIQKAQDIFFYNSMLEITHKNEMLIQTLLQISGTDYSTFANQLYDVRKTFGQSQFEDQLHFAGMVQVQMADFEWYYNHGHIEHARSVCAFIVGYALYAISLPVLSRALLILYYRISEEVFFTALGYPKMSFNNNGLLQKSAIIRELKKTVDLHKDVALQKMPEYRNLIFDDIAIFSKSWVEMIAALKPAI